MTRLSNKGLLFLLTLTVVSCSTFSRSSLSLAATALYDNGRDGSPLIDLIKKTKHEINIEIYSMEDPEVRNELRKAMDRGVKIEVVYEPKNGSCPLFKSRTDQIPTDQSRNLNCDDLLKFKKEVIASGGDFKPFNKAGLCEGFNAQDRGANCLQHGKMVIFDQKKVLFSTGNFNSTNLCNLSVNPSRCNRDYTLVVDDETIIKKAYTIFKKDLAGNFYDLKKVVGDSQSEFTVSPIALPTLLDLIQSAKKSIRVQNQYLNQPDINTALIEAAQRGVDVQIMVASFCSFSKPSPQDIAKNTKTYSEFDSAGIQTRIFTDKIKIQDKPGYLHAKAILVDDKTAWVGSINGSNQAFLRNREFGMIFTDTDSVKKLKADMKADFNDDHTESWQDSLVCRYDALGETRTPVAAH